MARRISPVNTHEEEKVTCGRKLLSLKAYENWIALTNSTVSGFSEFMGCTGHFEVMVVTDDPLFLHQVLVDKYGN